jgi:hypothetical protein
MSKQKQETKAHRLYSAVKSGLVMAIILMAVIGLILEIMRNREINDR